MKKTEIIATVAITASLYVALTLIFLPVSFGIIQCRISEILTVLPVFSPYSVVGLGVGCFISNFLSTVSSFDIIIGTLATVISALISRILRKYTVFGIPFLSFLAPPVINGIFIGFEITVFLQSGGLKGFLISAGTVFIEELIPCMLIGIPFFILIKNTKLEKFFNGTRK